MSAILEFRPPYKAYVHSHDHGDWWNRVDPAHLHVFNPPKNKKAYVKIGIDPIKVLEYDPKVFKQSDLTKIIEDVRSNQAAAIALFDEYLESRNPNTESNMTHKEWQDITRITGKTFLYDREEAKKFVELLRTGEIK
jgi:hypothetical protein